MFKLDDPVRLSIFSKIFNLALQEITDLLPHKRENVGQKDQNFNKTPCFSSNYSQFSNFWQPFLCAIVNL